jgi:predicted Rossmann fold nucleotide-binding protein DprA/Smf involved in DNA uptake
MVEDSEILEISPPIGLDAVFNGKPPKLWCSGEQRLLNGSLLGIISAREVDSDLAAKSAELLQELTSLKNVSFISGWHSPLEKEALRFLSGNSAQIIFCVAKSLQSFVPPAEVENRIRQGQALLLTHCSPKANRISREASLRRNQLVMALARTLLVLSAPKGSSSLDLAKAALLYGKPVLAPEHHLNDKLLESGALLANLENIQKGLRQRALGTVD